MYNRVIEQKLYKIINEIKPTNIKKVRLRILLSYYTRKEIKIYRKAMLNNDIKLLQSLCRCDKHVNKMILCPACELEKLRLEIGQKVPKKNK